MRVTLSLQVGRRLLYDTRSTETLHAVVGAKQSGDVEVHLVANYGSHAPSLLKVVAKS